MRLAPPLTNQQRTTLERLEQLAELDERITVVGTNSVGWPVVRRGDGTRHVIEENGELEPA